jgi:hypothetical protein
VRHVAQVLLLVGEREVDHLCVCLLDGEGSDRES